MCLCIINVYGKPFHFFHKTFRRHTSKTPSLRTLSAQSQSTAPQSSPTSTPLPTNPPAIPPPQPPPPSVQPPTPPPSRSSTGSPPSTTLTAPRPPSPFLPHPLPPNDPPASPSPQTTAPQPGHSSNPWQSTSADFPPRTLLPIPQPLASSANSPLSPSPLMSPSSPGLFTGAHDFVINNPLFMDSSRKGSGLEILFTKSMPYAFYDSAARDPPPRCHDGTWKDYITKITNWVLGNSDHHEPILWMHGPLGTGKSAVAQSCAEALVDHHNKLAAALFFSRSDRDRDDPRRVFTSIAYQIAKLHQSLRDIIDDRVLEDPALTTKSLSTQFEELLARPLREAGTARADIEGRIVIIDGLDECRGDREQRRILEIIAASVRDQTTPFRWLITSRPEGSILQSMKSKSVSRVSFRLELPVPDSINREIYLKDELERIPKHHFPQSWSPEDTLVRLVKHTAGPWVYVTAIARFVTSESPLGFETKLNTVIEFLKSDSTKAGTDNPSAMMDNFYTLVMKCVSKEIKPTVQNILLIQSLPGWNKEEIAVVLGLSKEQFHRSCTSVQSVMEIQGSDLTPMRMHFHHVSFLEYMQDSERSKEFCMYGSFLIDFRRELLEWVREICSRYTDPLQIIGPALPKGWDPKDYYWVRLRCFWDLCTTPGHPFDLQTAASFEQLQFRTMLQLIAPGYSALYDLPAIRNNLPTELHDKIIREGRCPTPGCTNTRNVLILGHGENEAVAEHLPDGRLVLKNNQNPLPGQCVCGSRVERDSSLKGRGL